MAQSFKEQHSLKERLEESTRIRQKYPERVPVIVEPSPYHEDKLTLDKRKYLVPIDLSIGQFIYIIRKRMNLKPSESIYLFTQDNILIPVTQLVSHTYELHKSNDNFLYIHVAKENTFGGSGSPPAIPGGERCRIGRTSMGELSILMNCSVESGITIGLAYYPDYKTNGQIITPFFGKYLRKSQFPSCRIEKDEKGFHWVITNRYLYSDDEVTIQ